MAAGLQQLADRFARVPYVRTLGAAVAALEPDRARLHVPYRDQNANRTGTVHGGLLASLIGAGASLVVATGVEDGATLTTVDLAVHFLAPATREGVVADARIVRRGREIAFVEVAVATDAGVPVARGLVACRAGRDAEPRGAVPGGAPPEVAADALCWSRVSGSPFTSRLGVTSAPLEHGRALAVLPYGPDVADGEGRVHEGALASLADSAGGASAWSVVGFARAGSASTVAMHLSFDVSVRDEDVLAAATTPWRAGAVLVNAVTFWGRTSGRPIGAGTVTYRIVV
jgi:acyl-CoA thioesterase